ncbi:hypothetical protein D3C87_1574050 [compost metagenome]
MHNIFQIDMLSLSLHLHKASFYPHGNIGSHKDFQLCMREYYSTDITAIHHDSFLLAHLLLLLHGKHPHRLYSSYFAYFLSNGHFADILFYIFIIQHNIRLLSKWVELKMQVNVFQSIGHTFLIIEMHIIPDKI